MPVSWDIGQQTFIPPCRDGDRPSFPAQCSGRTQTGTGPALLRLDHSPDPGNAGSDRWVWSIRRSTGRRLRDRQSGQWAGPACGGSADDCRRRLLRTDLARAWRPRAALDTHHSPDWPGGPRRVHRHAPASVCARRRRAQWTWCHRPGDNRAGACLSCSGSCTDQPHAWERWRLALAHSVPRSLELRDISGEFPAGQSYVAGATFHRSVRRDADPRLREHPMRTLFLQAPSYEGFDGGAGSRYQARREIRSFWFPTWLAQPAALVENSKLIDAPPHGTTLADILPLARDYDLVVAHTSTPSFVSDVKAIKALKSVNPSLKAGLIGAKVAVEADKSLERAPAVDFVARNEFDFTIKEIADGHPWKDVKGLSYRNADGVLVHNDDRTVLEDMDQLPFVTPVYKRDLRIERYFIGYLKHPYISLYTGRGCKSRCTFCLWPQTVGGHRYRTRSVGHVIEEIAWAKKAFPQVKEFFFDDDTFTDDLPRAEAIAKELGRLGVVWSCNAKANVPRKSLEVMHANGLRLLLVGYESGNQQILYNIKKGMLVDVARQFTKDCHDLGITIHGTFILGLPGESKQTIEETIRFDTEINQNTIQISLVAP